MIRRENRALQQYTNLSVSISRRMTTSYFFSKTHSGQDNLLLFAITVDPYNPQTRLCACALGGF